MAHRFDQLAQAHADGLSRRDALRAGVAGALGLSALSPLAAFARSPRRKPECTVCTTWPNSGRAREPVCVACDQNIPRHAPSPAMLSKLAHRDSDFRTLGKTAAVRGFRPSGGASIAYAHTPDSPTVIGGLVQPMRNDITKKAAALVFVHDTSAHPPNTAMLVSSPTERGSRSDVTVVLPHRSQHKPDGARPLRARRRPTEVATAAIDYGKCHLCIKGCQTIVQGGCDAGMVKELSW